MVVCFGPRRVLCPNVKPLIGKAPPAVWDNGNEEPTLCRKRLAMPSLWGKVLGLGEDANVIVASFWKDKALVNPQCGGSRSRLCQENGTVKGAKLHREANNVISVSANT